MPEVMSIADGTGCDVEDMVLHYGGDYELLFTIRPDMLDEIRDALGDKFSIIGKAEGRENVLIRGGKVSGLKSHGYEHFKKADP